jgi:hypothetical protein
VNQEGRREEQLTPSEERLVRLLGVLRAGAPPSGATLPGGVTRTASWQLFVKRVALTAGDVIVAAGETLATVFGLRPSRRRG